MKTSWLLIITYFKDLKIDDEIKIVFIIKKIINKIEVQLKLIRKLK